MTIERTGDRVAVVRCRDCKHCYSLRNVDPMEPYDGGTAGWYCSAWETEFYRPEHSADEYYCADGERMEKDG